MICGATLLDENIHSSHTQAVPVNTKHIPSYADFFYVESSYVSHTLQNAFLFALRSPFISDIHTAFPPSAALCERISNTTYSSSTVFQFLILNHFFFRLSTTFLRNRQELFCRYPYRYIPVSGLNQALTGCFAASDISTDKQHRILQIVCTVRCKTFYIASYTVRILYYPCHGNIGYTPVARKI